ncbi:MAG TPA: hypothetical protein VF121_12035 [Thermoanaerobaculia bacterium]|nr:hypothetical protein [Thermoanaerobaculia bacterium]
MTMGIGKHGNLLLGALLLLPPPAYAEVQRGPSTPEERAKAVELVRVLETAPVSPAAKEARQWLTVWLAEVPDLTVKVCFSLLGSKQETASLPAELRMQHAYSSAAWLIEHPDTNPGSTETLLAGVRGTLRSYEAWKTADPAVSHALLEALLAMERTGTLEQHVRQQGRYCR